MKIKKNDMVQVIQGRDRGKKGKVYRVDSKNEQVWIEGVNVVKRHQRPTQSNKQGGIIEKVLPIHISKVMYFDEKANKPSRIGYRILDNGEKVRYSKKTGDVIKSV